MNSNAETELAPLRSLDDFILSQSRLNLMHILSEINLHPSSRFQVPEYQNVDKFRNRIVSNLIYYQTNYALSSVLLFCLITFMNPFKMFLGMSTMTICNQLWIITREDIWHVLCSVWAALLGRGETGPSETDEEGTPNTCHDGNIPLWPFSHLPGSVVARLYQPLIVIDLIWTVEWLCGGLHHRGPPPYIIHHSPRCPQIEKY